MIQLAAVQNWLGANSAVGSRFRWERDNTRSRLSESQQEAASHLQAAMGDWRRPSRFEAIGTEFVRLSNFLCETLPRSILLDVNRLVILELALRLPEAMADRNIPEVLRALYPAALQRLIEFLQLADDQDYFYPNEFFLKDIRFAGGLTVPRGAQVVDLRSVIGRRASMHSLLRKFARMRFSESPVMTRLSPWFRIHTDTRYLDEFNEPGWDMCYRRIAALLVEHPGVQGMVGTSWFYDP